MNEKILLALKTKYKNLGLSDKVLEAVSVYLATQITEETQIETAISGVECVLKPFQGEAEKLRGEKTSIQKELEELKKKQVDPVPPPVSADIDEKIKAAIETANKPILDELRGYKEKDAALTRSNFISDKAKELNIPEWRVKEGFNFTNETTDEDIASALASIKQNIIMAGLGGKPGVSINFDDKPTNEQTDAILDKIGI